MNMSYLKFFWVWFGNLAVLVVLDTVLSLLPEMSLVDKAAVYSLVGFFLGLGELALWDRLKGNDV